MFEMMHSSLLLLLLFPLLHFVALADPVETKLNSDTTTGSGGISFVIEHNFPKYRIIEVGQEFNFKIWPKDEKGSNITMTGIKLAINPFPLSSFEIDRVDKSNNNYVEIAFKIIQPENPAVIAIYHEGKALPDTPFKFAAIETGILSSSESSVLVASQQIKIGELFGITLDCRDSYKNPTIEGSNLIQFAGENIHELRITQSSVASQPGLINLIGNSTNIGVYHLNVTYKGKHLIGSPLRLEFHHSQFAPEKTKIKGFGSWIAEIGGVNIFYMQLFDRFGNSFMNDTSIFPPELPEGSQTADSTNPQDQTPPEAEKAPPVDSISKEAQERAYEIRDVQDIKVVALNYKYEAIKDFRYVLEYLGKATWGIKYSISCPSGQFYLGISYGPENIKITETLLEVTAQPGPFPYPPNTYKLVGPYPARNEIIEPDFRTLSIPPQSMKSFSLSNDGWLDVSIPVKSLANVDYRAILLGSFHVETPGKFLMICNGADKYSLGNLEFFSGEIWNTHEFEVRDYQLVVYTFSKKDWKFQFQCKMQPFTELKAYESESIVPDIVEGYIMGEISILLQNLGNTSISDLQAKVVSTNDTTVKPVLSLKNPNKILPPGELEQVQFALTFEDTNQPKASLVLLVAIYSPSHKVAVQVRLLVRIREQSEPFKYSYIDSDGTRQLAVATRPKEECSFSTKCPVVLVMRGGGASILELADYFPAQVDGWTVVPAARTIVPFETSPLIENSSMYAIYGLADLIVGTAPLYLKYQVNFQSIFAVGSQYTGGKAAISFANHHPDKIIGVSADSGWVKHGEPRTDDFVNPILNSLLSVSTIEDDFTFSIANLKSIPILAGVGKGDVGGFPWRINYEQGLFKSNGIEVKTDPHLGDGFKSDTAVAPTGEVLSFIEKRLAKKKLLPKSFQIQAWNPASYDGRGGIRILAKEIFISVAAIDVNIMRDEWTLQTTNVKTFQFTDRFGASPKKFIIDGTTLDVSSGPAHCFSKHIDQWKFCDAPIPRNLNQYGPASKLFQKSVSIVYGTVNLPEAVITKYKNIATYISNEIYKRFRADVQIFSDLEYLTSKKEGNVFVLGGPESNELTHDILKNFRAMQWSNSTITVGPCTFSTANEIGTLFLAPYNNNLAFVVSAASVLLFEDLGQILPIHPPYNAFPDYVVFNTKRGTNGAAAILSAGYWSSSWEYERESAYVNCAKASLTNGRGVDPLW